MFKSLGKLFLIKPGALSETEKEFYRELSFENFIFFKEHFEVNFEEYLSSLRYSLGKLKFLAVDQEGGRVCRIKGDFESPYEIVRKAKAKGEEVFIRWAERIAETLRNHGLNLNLAPVVDREDENPPDFLKARTFGKNYEEITHYAEIFTELHKRKGIKICLKHFPGLYGVKIDPHKELPLKEKILEEDLYPFKRLSSKADFIMTTHLLIPDLDKKMPFTFSEKGIAFLRRETEFKGAILTDDLTMEALKDFPLTERIIYSLVSGHNLLVYCGSYEDLMEALLEEKKEFEKSSILKEKIRESLTILERY